ncbi:hypothetical protein QM012_003093 [Aureobasidium pullulans]|uniref:Uncharacterized protein n=1 Tax=Aureobasidium pullulans TaxID=5580 RepID=A0ABR0TAL7_AURPU
MAIKKSNMGGPRWSLRRRRDWRNAINRIEHRCARRIAFAPSRAEPQAPVDFSFGPPSPPSSPSPPLLLPLRGPVLHRYSPPPLGWRDSPAPPPAPRPRAANLPLGFVAAPLLPPYE